jgi:hypothetical protein
MRGKSNRGAPLPFRTMNGKPPYGIARLLRVVSISLLLSAAVGATEAQDAVNRLSEVVVQAEAESPDEERVQAPFLPDVQQTRINAGKKTSVIDFDKMPQVQTDNYRQAFSQTPGLLVSELLESEPAQRRVARHR